MKSSYKVALVVALVIVVVGVFYYRNQEPAAGTGKVAPITDDASVKTTQRPTLADAPPRTPPSKQPAGDPADLFARVQAQVSSISPSPQSASAAEVKPTETTAPATTTSTPAATPMATTTALPPSSVTPPSPPPPTSEASATTTGTESTSTDTTGAGLAPLPISSTPSSTTMTTPTTSTSAASSPSALTSSTPPGTSSTPATTTTTTPPTTTPSGRTYTIQHGDTFSSIAISLYGSERHWVDIAQANPLVDPQRLKVGQVIRLPDSVARSTSASGQPGAIAAAPTPAPPPARDEPAGGVTYVVKHGETLSAIAKHYYNDARLWRVIYNANRDRIGSNPDKLKAGTRLVIPPAPNGAR